MSMKKILQESLGVTIFDAVRSMINGKYIMYYGVIQEVMADGVVMVAPSVINTKSDYIAVPCVLGTVAGDSVALNIIPKVKDKVMVFSPRLYDHNMFQKDNDGALIVDTAYGYSPYAGIAFLMNQYRTADHHNVITVDSGKIEARLAYDEESSSEEDTVNQLVISTDSDGNVELKAGYDDEEYTSDFNIKADGTFKFKNPKASAEIKPEGDIELFYKDKASIKIKSGEDTDGEIEISNTKASITIDKDGNVTIDSKGKYTIKNNGVSLKDIFDGLSDILSPAKFTTVGSPATQKMSPDTGTLVTTWSSSKVSGFFGG